jgi:7-cyano-7-deazaguanine synthase
MVDQVTSERTEAALVLASGGIDSMACAHFLLALYRPVTALFVNYGQLAYQAERTAVTAVARTLQIPLERASVNTTRPYGPGEIPGRNGLLAMVALAGCMPTTRLIAMGIHSGTPYYDCSPAFANRIDDLIREYTSGRTRFFAPFLTWNKGDIYEYCYNARLDLSMTYSCEAGTVPPCGQCASCQDRRMLHVR